MFGLASRSSLLDRTESSVLGFPDLQVRGLTCSDFLGRLIVDFYVSLCTEVTVGSDVRCIE